MNGLPLLGETTSYFGKRERGWMVNFLVRDLTVIIAQLEAATP